jgi:type I restriction enzyme M protein
VIQLPSDLFFGTSIATCILVLKKSKKDNKTMFIDASAEFVRANTKNKLDVGHRAKILDSFTNRENTEYFSRLVDNAEIAQNDYNLSVSSYVVKEDTREVIDITTLNAEIDEIVLRQSKLRTSIDKIVRNLESSV